MRNDVFRSPMENWCACGRGQWSQGESETRGRVLVFTGILAVGGVV
jgi:hypothetical protein